MRHRNSHRDPVFVSAVRGRSIFRPAGAFVAALALALSLAAPALAAHTRIGIQDDRILYFSPGEAPSVVAQWAAMGIDIVRVTAKWSSIAPSPRSTRPPGGFQAASPADRRYRWRDLDRVIGLVTGNGMQVMLTLPQYGPVWASQQPQRHNPAYEPDPVKYAQFATAVAKRYRGRINTYLLGNEPNQNIFLQPQRSCTRAGCDLVAAGLYRNLVNAAYPAIKRVDRAPVAIGELAPIGSSGRSGGVKPLAFLRAMGCVDNNFHNVRTGACRHFRAARGDLFGYHPYGVRIAPDRHVADPDLASIGDLPRLTSTLDRLANRRRLGGGHPALALTEFGYESNPPDRASGVSPALQSRYLQQAAYVAWRNSRVQIISQYEWRDEPTSRSGANRYGGFQSGLYYLNGRAKPARSTFPHPFYVDNSRGNANAVFWGQVRPGAFHTVVLERQSGSAWVKVRSAVTDGLGYFALRIRAIANSNYRYTYEGHATSDVVHVYPH